MVNALLIEKTFGSLTDLEILISRNCPDVQLLFKASSLFGIQAYFKDQVPDIVFMDVEDFDSEEFKLLNKYPASDFELIFITDRTEQVFDALIYGAAGYLLKPVKDMELAQTVDNAIRIINRKREYKKNFHQNDNTGFSAIIEQIIGVPTFEGFEFIQIKDIIRCEGLQNCTRIVTKDKTDLISSNNLGEFRRLLEPYGFYSPHKSHLVNLMSIRKYNREGNILLENGTHVPVSKRKKKEFINQFKHL